MKIFATLLLLGAFVAYVSAFEMPFHKAVFKFLDERHDERMAQVVRDFGLPEDTLAFNDINAPNPTAPAKPVKPEGLPPFIIACVGKAQVCWKVAGHDECKKLGCIDNFFKCIKENHPTPLPELSPLEKGCLFLLHICRKGSPTCAGELCCFLRIKKCFELAEGKEKLLE